MTDSMNSQQALLSQIPHPASEVRVSDPSGGTWDIHNTVQPPLIHLRSQHVHTPKQGPREASGEACGQPVWQALPRGPATRRKSWCRAEARGRLLEPPGLSRPLAGTSGASQLPPTLPSDLHNVFLWPVLTWIQTRKRESHPGSATLTWRELPQQTSRSLPRHRLPEPTGGVGGPAAGPSGKF